MHGGGARSFLPSLGAPPPPWTSDSASWKPTVQEFAWSFISPSWVWGGEESSNSLITWSSQRPAPP